MIVKPFVALLKQKTIPQLELLGCLSLTGIYKTCQEALAVSNLKDYDRLLNSPIVDQESTSRIQTICISSVTEFQERVELE